VITPRYFDIVDVKPVRGRSFERTDGPDAQPVAIVNERFVELFFTHRDPLGARIKLGQDDVPWRTIVGVVPDLHLGGAIGALNPRHEGVYIPLAQNVINFMSLVVGTNQAAMSYTATIQDEIHRRDQALPLYWVRSLADQYALDTWFYRAFGTLFVAFGLAALAMATIGLYGVMSFSTANRTREIGVRMALGAARRNVLLMILRQGAWQIAAGLALGLGLAALLSRGLGILLFGVRPWDPAVFAGVVLALAAAGMLASFIPAQRATRIEPVDALRLD
jgi:predicted lysophospholipase L1 biosynthesis ABC-type transport system permease subunit